MDTVQRDFEVGESSAPSLHPDLLLSAALHLISNYALQVTSPGHCPKLASVIERHLRVLAELPDSSPVVRSTCEHLSEQWVTLVERAIAKQDKPGLAKRFLRLVQ